MDYVQNYQKLKIKKKNIMNNIIPKMTTQQAKLFWNSLTTEQKKNFNKMFSELIDNKLQLTYIGVDDNEQIQHIVLDQKGKPSKPIEPFSKHFKQD